MQASSVAIAIRVVPIVMIYLRHVMYIVITIRREFYIKQNVKCCVAYDL